MRTNDIPTKQPYDVYIKRRANTESVSHKNNKNAFSLSSNTDRLIYKQISNEKSSLILFLSTHTTNLQQNTYENIQSKKDNSL